MVQRYDLQEDWVTGHIDLEKDTDGDWVSYEDYAELARKFNELKAWRTRILNDASDSLTRAEKAEAELQKYKDQFPDYVECPNGGSFTYVEWVE